MKKKKTSINDKNKNNHKKEIAEEKMEIDNSITFKLNIHDYINTIFF